jgi:hypothetical protein
LGFVCSGMNEMVWRKIVQGMYFDVYSWVWWKTNKLCRNSESAGKQKRQAWVS